MVEGFSAADLSVFDPDSSPEPSKKKQRQRPQAGAKDEGWEEDKENHPHEQAPMSVVGSVTPTGSSPAVGSNGSTTASGSSGGGGGAAEEEEEKDGVAAAKGKKARVVTKKPAFKVQTKTQLRDRPKSQAQPSHSPPSPPPSHRQRCR